MMVSELVNIGLGEGVWGEGLVQTGTVAKARSLGRVLARSGGPYSPSIRSNPFPSMPAREPLPLPFPACPARTSKARKPLYYMHLHALACA